MRLYIRLYQFLVNRNPGIHIRYQEYRQRHTSFLHRMFGWGYLLLLNFRYYVLQDKSIHAATFSEDADAKICLPRQCESDVMSVESPEELARRLLDADVVSFDVFDTLILRPFCCPQDLFFELELRLRYPGLKELRQRAEDMARGIKSGTREVNLAGIWAQVHHLTGIDPQLGMQTEWQIEQEACRGNPYFLDVVNRLKAKGKKLIVCSDMYLNGEQIRQLLLQCGFPLFDRYFISCEQQASKSDGSLFRYVRDEIGDAHCIHIGDNAHSDVRQAQRAGFRAIHYRSVGQAGASWRPKAMSPLVGSAYVGIVNTQLHNGKHRWSKPYELGFVYGGLLVTGYCQFIHRYVHAAGIDRILFLARDGEILDKAYRQMYPQDASLCRYVWWSRLAATKLSAPERKEHFLSCMVRHKINGGYTIADVFGTMQLEDMLEPFLEACTGKTCPGDLLTKKTAVQLCAYLDSRWEQVCAHYTEEIREGGVYYSGQLEGASKALAVDIGWVGTGPLLLKHLVEDIWKLNCSVTGMMAGTYGESEPGGHASAAELADGTLVSYLFSAAHNREFWKNHNPAAGHNLLMELILCATTPSFRGFLRQPDGDYWFNACSEKIDAQAVQRGILDFAAAYTAHPFGRLQISGADAMAPIRILCENRWWVQDLIHDSGIRANLE